MVAESGNTLIISDVDSSVVWLDWCRQTSRLFPTVNQGAWLPALGLHSFARSEAKKGGWYGQRHRNDECAVVTYASSLPHCGAPSGMERGNQLSSVHEYLLYELKFARRDLARCRLGYYFRCRWK